MVGLGKLNKRDSFTMNISQHEEGGIIVIALGGRVDTAGAIELERALQAEHEAGNYRLVLDMSDLTYLNSAGLRILADFLTISRDNGGDLHLAALNNKIRRVFEIIGFDNFFKIFDESSAAIKGF
jgi:anti-anti-sigma factor